MQTCLLPNIADGHIKCLLACIRSLCVSVSLLFMVEDQTVLLVYREYFSLKKTAIGGFRFINEKEVLFV